MPSSIPWKNAAGAIGWKNKRPGRTGLPLPHAVRCIVRLWSLCSLCISALALAIGLPGDSKAREAAELEPLPAPVSVHTAPTPADLPLSVEGHDSKPDSLAPLLGAGPGETNKRPVSPERNKGTEPADEATAAPTGPTGLEPHRMVPLGPGAAKSAPVQAPALVPVPETDR